MFEAVPRGIRAGERFHEMSTSTSAGQICKIAAPPRAADERKRVRKRRSYEQRERLQNGARNKSNRDLDRVGVLCSP